MFRVSKVSSAIKAIEGWHRGEVPIQQAETILGTPTGNLLTFFRENGLVDARDKPVSESSPQHAVNCVLMYLSLLSLSRRKK